MAGISLGGLSSGLDSEAIISQLMAIERQPKTRLTQSERRAEGRKTALEDIARSLRTLKNTATDLKSTTTFAQVQSMSSADPTKVGARSIGSAPAGTYAIDVQWFARAAQHSYDYEPVGGDAQQITVGTAVIDIPAGTSDQGVADLINAAPGAGALAGLVNGKLTITGKAVGEAISVSSSTGSLLNEAIEPHRLTRYSVNGVVQTDTLASVVQPGGLPGVELTLKAVGATSVTIGAPAVDADAVKAKVKAFVDAYNATIDLVRGKLNEKPVKNATSTNDLHKGTLYSDPGLSSLLSRMRQTMGEPVAGFATTTINELSDIGVGVPPPQTSGTPSPDRLAGKLVIDDAKLSAALAGNVTAVQDFLTSATGFAQKLEAFVDPISRTGTGALALRSTEVDSQISRLRSQSVDMDKRLELKEKRLRAQFTQLEVSLNASKTQQSWLTGQLAQYTQ